MTKYVTILFTIIGTILLTSCNDQQQIITSYRYMVVHPDEAMYNCPVLKEFPNWKTLTDAQVARVIVQLQKNNLTCKSSIEAIREFINKADEIEKGGQPAP